MRRPISNASWSVVTVIGLVLGCTVPHQEGREVEPFYPLVFEIADGSVRYEFGPGRLRTTGDRPWQGSSSYTYPPILAPNAGPITIEIQGLNLSAIRYAGDLSWPPGRADRGATVEAGLKGAFRLSYRVSSALDGKKNLWDGRVLGTGFSRYRAYLFQVLRDGTPLGAYHFNSEAWGGESHPEYDTFDVRLEYADGVAPWRVRLHTSEAWTAGHAASGSPCPWNPALNTAAAGTADSIWTGGCTPGDTGTGQALGAWLAPEAPWAGRDLGFAQPQIAISNWAHAYGGDEVSWDNVVVTGVPVAGSSMTLGSGQIRATGTARTTALVPQGEKADFSFVSVTQPDGGASGAWLHFRTGRLDLVSVGSTWVATDSTSVSFGGNAIVNGEHGYRYEAWATHPVSPDVTPRMSVSIKTVDGLPIYMAFGPLVEGGIDRWVP